jgi:hypothetical protein
METIRDQEERAPGAAGRLPGESRPPAAPETGSDSSLQVSVLFTTTQATLTALKRAGQLAAKLGARITVITPQIVPFPLDLPKPTIDPAFTARKAQAIVAGFPGEAEIKVCLCRQAIDAAVSVLKPHSLVLVGGRRRLWPTAETRLARDIRSHGHQVLFIDQE